MMLRRFCRKRQAESRREGYSMGFHSYRNIGFSFTDAKTTCQKWRDRFTGFCSEEKESWLTFFKEEEYIRIVYFGQEYRLNCRNGVLEKKGDT